MANADINNVPRFRMPNFRSRLHDHIFYLNLIRLLSPRDGEINHNNIYIYLYHSQYGIGRVNNWYPYAAS